MSVLKEKFGIKYYAELGIIDLFGLSLSENELKERARFDSQDSYGSHWRSFYENINASDIDAMVSEIKNIIKNETNEEPCVVRFFAVPDFGYLGFNLCPIAKITNNGSTFVFSQSKGLLEYLNEVNGIQFSIEMV